MKLSAFVILLLVSLTISAQFSADQVNHINKQIVFINESLHGMLVAHRIYEGYNQEVNKYIDLPSHNINQYTNDDLPTDIFEDKEKWFYDKSPNRLYQEIQNDKTKETIPFRTLKIIEDLKVSNTFINSDRSTIEAIMKSPELQQLGGIQKVYKELETAIDYYDRALVNVDQYEKDLMPFYHVIPLSENRKKVYTALLEIHYDIKAAIRNIRKNNQSGVMNLLPKIKKEIGWLKVCNKELTNPSDQEKMPLIETRLIEIAKLLDDYLNNKNVPAEYAVFGKGYYYHNVLLLTKMNRYGTGYVTHVNELLSSNNWGALFLLEEPHYLKVVYPETIPLETLQNKEIDNTITIKELTETKKLPPHQAEEPPLRINKDTIIAAEQKKESSLDDEDLILVASPIKESPRIIRSSHEIVVDSLQFELELYDHRVKDGDRVSINVNGEWVFTNISLEKAPRRILLTITPGKENYIMIHADNIGWMPPNTVGIRYRSKGKVENIFLKTDLNTSELIEIKYDIGN